MRLYRCHNLKCKDSKHGHEFMGEIPVCDKCGADGRIPKFQQYIQDLVILHYRPSMADFPEIGEDYYACKPDERPPRGRNTRHPPAVTCPLCKVTDVFVQDMKDEEFDEELDIPVEVGIGKDGKVFRKEG